MKEDDLVIYIDRLKGGKEEEIQLSILPTFLEIEEKELVFPSPISVQGKAYLAGSELVIEVTLDLMLKLPCPICNEMCKHPLLLKNVRGCFSLDEIKKSVFHLPPFLREEILVQVPPFLECQKGRCPERQQVKEYLRQKKEKSNNHLPFKDLI